MTRGRTWGDIARSAISRVHFRLPENATLAERKAAVDAAYPFMTREYWPYKAWLRARKAYLRPYGYRSRGEPKDPPPLFADLPRDPVSGRPVIK